MTSLWKHQNSPVPQLFMIIMLSKTWDGRTLFAKHNETKRNEGLEVPQNKLIQKAKEGRVKPNKDSRQTSSHNWDLLLHYFWIQLKQLCSKCFCLISWINDVRYDSKRCFCCKMGKCEGEECYLSLEMGFNINTLCLVFNPFEFSKNFK